MEFTDHGSTCLPSLRLFSWPRHGRLFRCGNRGHAAARALSFATRGSGAAVAACALPGRNLATGLLARRNARNLKVLLPAAVSGVVYGWLFAAHVSDDAVRILSSTTAFAFIGNIWMHS